MAGRAQISQVLSPVVEAVAVDVVDLQNEPLALPGVSHSAGVADVRDLQVVECAPKLGRLGTGGTGRQPHQDLARGLALSGRDTTAVALADEMVGADAVDVQAALQASPARAVVGDAELLQHPSEAPG
uniref:Uncharacterized protein n=1 Tax=Streptomyces sp. NBC_00003 TaxID=2903608 RepID=A0AAU2V8Z7_9ACTN